jgi:lysozyme
MLEEEKKPSIISKTLEKIKNLGKPSAKPIAINHDAKQIAMKTIKVFEGCRLEAYKCTAGVWTIGYGHIQGVKEGMKITQEQAEIYFESDIMEYLVPVQKEVGQICNANQIAALTSFAFNLGNEALKKSTLLKVIKKTPNDFAEIEKQFLRWDKVTKVVKGKVEYISSSGLKKRREKEVDLYKKA